MKEQGVCLVSQKNASLILRLNRPEDSNRTTTEMLNSITAAVRSANEDDSIHCIVITGNERHFCCGGRVDPAASEEEKSAYSKAITDMQQSLSDSSVPILAAVEGDCTAGGNDLLALSDIAVARKGVHFGFPEITYGSFPVMVMVNTIDVIPQKRLLPFFYTGELFDAETAFRLGMLTEIAAPEDFWDRVHHYTEILAAIPRATLAVGRKAYYGMCPLSITERKAFGDRVLREVWKEQAASGKKY